MWFEGLKRWRSLATGLVLTAATGAATLHAQPLSGQDARVTPEGVVTEIYDLVSYEAGARPDWEKVRALFIPEAVIVLRTSRDSTTVFSVDGFIDDFVRFVERSPAGEAGFTEKILRMKSLVFGDMAHVLVLYEAHITDSPRPPTQGVDSFSLIQRDGRWWIAAVTNELPSTDRPIPEVLRTEQ